jgi:hypothetical protein
MVGNLFRGQEDAEQILDLAKADPHGGCGDDQSSQFGLVAEGPAFGLTLQFGDLRLQLLVLRAECGDVSRGGLANEPLLDLTGMLIDGLAAAAGQFGLLRDGPMATCKDSGGVENPGTRR